MIRENLHLVLHIAVPAAIAAVFYRPRFLRVWLTLVATMVVDLDHLLADPVYDPGRCSIGFHPLHTWPAIAAFSLAALWPKLRVLALGLMIHMALDGVDCVWMAFEN